MPVTKYNPNVLISELDFSRHAWRLIYGASIKKIIVCDVSAFGVNEISLPCQTKKKSKH